MMVEYRSREAKRNLRKGVQKMEKSMTPAARARRDFRLGRPPKPGESLPLHPKVVWDRAQEALFRFRTLMTLEKLEEKDVTAAIVYIEMSDPDKPHLLLLEKAGKTSEECKQGVFEQLGRHDVIALGMIFQQIDAQKSDAEKTRRILFPYQFTGLNEHGIAVLRRAAAEQYLIGELSKNVN